MKLMTLNMHCGMENNFDEKLNRIVDYIIEEDISLIALQEVGQQFYQDVILENFGVDIKRNNHVEILAKKLNEQSDYHYDYYFDWSHLGFESIEEGSAILTTHPIISVDSKYVSFDQTVKNWKSRKIIKMKLDVNGKALDVYSCHLGWWHDEDEPAKEQFNKLNTWVMNDEVPSILCGDFNNPAGKEGYEYLVDQLGYRDLYYEANLHDFYGPTFYKTKKNASLEIENIDERIDYIFTKSPEVKVTKAKRVFTKEEGMVSDHVAIMAVLQIN